MSTLRYCTLCKREVEVRKGFNWLPFLFLFGAPYLIFYLLFKARKCPICGGKDHLTKSSRIDGDIYIDMASEARVSSSRKTKSS